MLTADQLRGNAVDELETGTAAEAATEAPAAPSGTVPARPEWLESTKHTRRRRKAREPRDERPRRNPWLVLAVVAAVVVVVGGLSAVALQRWLDRSLVTVPETLGRLTRSSDPELLRVTQAMRDAFQRDPKYAASRYEAVPYEGGGTVSYVVLVPGGSEMGEDDLASIAATTAEVEYGAPFRNGDAHCIAGSSSQGTESYCYTDGPDFTVIAITVPDDASATTGARVVQDGYAAQH